MLGIACDKRLVVFKVLVKSEDGSCLKRQMRGVEPAIVIVLLQWLVHTIVDVAGKFFFCLFVFF
jgi:hypothetical protein